MNAKVIEFDIDTTEAEEEYDGALDGCGTVSAGGMEFYPSDILKNCDPIAYRCGMIDHFDGRESYECGECGEVFDDDDEAEECCEV